MIDLADLPWNQFTLETSPMARISKNFRFYELTRSETAERQLIHNSFKSIAELRSAVYLCRKILQSIRNKFGAFTPNSVYRCQELERALKKKPNSWTSTSQHTKGQACDVEIPGLPTIELAQWIKENLEFDQLICECYDPSKGPNSGWVHVSVLPPASGDNRHSVLSYILEPSEHKYVYVEGLRESIA